ncbi:MAG: sigma-70 family RNA polymerase sigma factor [Niabella sp.]
MMELSEKLFEELFYKYYDRVYAGLLSKNCSPTVAEELTQLTFIKIWEYRASFAFEISPEAQIFKKARHVFIDWLRKEAHQRKLIEEMRHISLKIQQPQLELTDTLKNALEQLPPQQKEVFRLSYIEGFSHKEIAESLGISIRTVDRHIYKSLINLRKTLAFLVIMELISHFLP